MIIRNSKQSACICKIVISIGLVIATSSADRVFAQDTLEQLLTKAMENHPDIVAAKAKVTLADAELNATRLQIARQIITLWGNREMQNRIVSQQKTAFEKGLIPIGEFRDNEAKLHQLDTELLYITGKETPVTQQSKNSSTKNKKEVQIPTGPIVEKLRNEFPAKTIDFEFVDTPLDQVIDYMANYLRFPVYLDKVAIQSNGMETDSTISMNVKNTPLTAAIQAFEDFNFFDRNLQFVIRDYGLVLTTRETAEEKGYYPALEFAKSIEKAKSTEVNPLAAPQSIPPERSPRRRELSN